jgi:hypothetical protein
MLEDTIKRILTLILAAAAPGLGACDGGGGEEDVTTDDAVTEDVQAEETTGADGYPAALPPVDCNAADCTWTGCPEQPPEGDPVTVRLVLADFAEDFAVENAYVDVFLGNVVTGTPDFELGPTDADGATDDFQAPANALIAYRVNGSTDIPYPPGEIKTTIEYGQPVPETGGDIDAIAVSRMTYQLIPTVLGIPPTPGLGILAGAFNDCGDREVIGVVARLYPQGSAEPCNDEVAVRCLDRYFIDETPARDQKWSSEDGLYGILEIPPGEAYTLELHGKVTGSACPGEMEVVGEMPGVRILPDAISIVDVAAGTAAEHNCLW